ncbi:hypothetical protein HWV00_10670 [Moritella sp. 24]|uniref:hypothetical protein n=1 Tax=Moritella sp. 24 TaxID=2746230 RepID=UPI001BAAEA22|nr:hypothetical protein [Moritella sp. 24]QUM76655.1 hypothetical protein HWV00_10670 [Moritella sp. 24]
MKNSLTNFLALLIGFISFIFITGLGFVLTTTLLVIGLIAKPFLLKNLKQKLNRANTENGVGATSGTVYEGKFERVND